LTLFDGLNKARRLMERLVGSRIQPSHSATHDLYPELVPPEVLDVDVRYLKFTPGRRLKVRGYVQHLVVVEVEPRDRVVRAGPLGLLH
jgi:hypothetical protein